MSKVMTKSSLSPGRRYLVELAQETNHGRIVLLPVLDGEPQFDPPPTVLRLFLIGKDNGPHPAHCKEDFIIKEEWVELFKLFDREQSFIIDELVIADGLPVRMTVREKA